MNLIWTVDDMRGALSLASSWQLHEDSVTASWVGWCRLCPQAHCPFHHHLCYFTSCSGSWELPGAMRSLHGCFLPGNVHLFPSWMLATRTCSSFLHGRQKEGIYSLYHFWNVLPHPTQCWGGHFLDFRCFQPPCIKCWIYQQGVFTWKLGFNVLV